ncbi:ChaN family lipoprotein [Actibacterium ureilyticum]|uniref:ChaN family lipoprotein n=1 Tax=Actibacterium ureilyticum TaxID=1590614 RepID=UPI000BAAAEC9|nr:ChaN family lipoprotein [Actibacterium ureilyticum]
MRTCLTFLLLGAAAAHAAQIDATALDALPPADVVILGEVHDNPTHHAHQAAAVSALSPAALVFEMLDPDQAARVTPALRSDADALAQALGWADSGWPDFALYHPIFTATDAPVYGGALPRDQVRAAIGDGAAVAFGADAAAFGLDAPLPDDQQATRQSMQQEAHCNALPEEMLPGMVDAQRLRDAGLARAITRAWAETGGPVAVITGNGHARHDWGIPAVLSVAAPDLSVLSIGQLEAAPEATPPYDLWILTAPTPRDDPCAAFRAN